MEYLEKYHKKHQQKTYTMIQFPDQLHTILAAQSARRKVDAGDSNPTLLFYAALFLWKIL